ncbi:MAG: hypothetical protein H0T76_11140 [Nannocystis sp.]|nr:hypothetical protein [Nannocystis sp.]MBA3547029.1 hypothetical protein [Nannocystis sp.]
MNTTIARSTSRARRNDGDGGDNDGIEAGDLDEVFGIWRLLAPSSGAAKARSWPQSAA